MHAVTTIATLVRKDIRLELRNLQIVPLSAVLVLAATLVLRLAGGAASASLGWIGTLWVVTLIVAVVIFDRALADETHNGQLGAMLSGPVRTIELLLAKLIFTGGILVIMQLLTVICVMWWSGQAIDRPWIRVVPVVALADFGILLVGLMCALIATMSRHRTALLASMLWPLALPMVLIAAVSLRVFDGATAEQYQQNGWLILTAFDVILFGLWPVLAKMILGR